MSDSHELSWSDNPNAPNIPYRMYSAEKTWFAGTLISLILYGMRKRSPLTHSPTHAHRLVGSVYSRDAHRAILQMHERAIQPRPSQGGERQVGACVLHRLHVLVGDRAHRNE